MLSLCEEQYIRQLAAAAIASEEPLFIALWTTFLGINSQPGEAMSQLFTNYT